MGWPIDWKVAASQSRIVLSWLAEAICFPSGLNATLDTLPSCPTMGSPYRLERPRVPHLQCVIRNAGDYPLPVGAERHTHHPARVGASRIFAVGRTSDASRRHRFADGLRVVASHTRTVLSQLPETNRCPSALNARLATTPECPVSGSPIGFPVSASHSRIVVSLLPETMSFPSGLNATVLTSPCGRPSVRRSGCRLPIPNPYAPSR